MTNSEMSELKTPLMEAQHNGELKLSLKELYNKDPLEYTAEDRRRLIKAMAKRREVWFGEELRAANAGKKPSHQTKGTADIDALVEELSSDGMPELDLSVLED